MRGCTVQREQRSTPGRGSPRPMGKDPGPFTAFRLGKIVLLGTVTLVGVVLAVSWAMDVTGDPEIRRLLNSPPVAEAFKQSSAQARRRGQSRITPGGPGPGLCPGDQSTDTGQTVGGSDRHTVRRSAGTSGGSVAEVHAPGHHVLSLRAGQVHGPDMRARRRVPVDQAG